MVKANAYGLGAVAVARGLEALDPWGFGVATADEGRELREAGIVRPILVVQPTLAMLPGCARMGLTPVLGGEVEVRAWLGLGTLPFHVGIDTGMNRGRLLVGGVRVGRCRCSRRRRASRAWATHFHSAERDPSSVRKQWQLFETGDPRAAADGSRGEFRGGALDTGSGRQPGAAGHFSLWRHGRSTSAGAGRQLGAPDCAGSPSGPRGPR